MIALTHPLGHAGAPTDAFGWRAAIPGVVGAQLHTGQDYAAPTGTPVYAAHSGRVNRVWWDTMMDGSPAGGNMLQIGAAQCSTRYAHLDAYNVRDGQHVTAGDLIGWVGSTGAATGAHLHFELLLPGGQFVDPRPYMTGDTMTPAQLKQIIDAINATPQRTLDAKIARIGKDKDGKPRTGHTSLRQRAADEEAQIGYTRRYVERIELVVNAIKKRLLIK